MKNNKILFLTMAFVFLLICFFPGDVSANARLAELLEQKERIERLENNIAQFIILCEARGMTEASVVLQELLQRTKNLKAMVVKEIGGKKKYTLSVTKGVLDIGRIYTDPRGLECLSGRAHCSYDFDAGEEVTIILAPRSGTDIFLWTGDCSGTERRCVVVMDSDKLVTALIGSVISPKHTLKIHKSGTGGGEIKSTPEGISCKFQRLTPATRCEHDFEIGTTVVLEAVADPDSKFIGWQTATHPIECTEVTGNKCKVFMFGDKHIRPNFEAFNLFIEVVDPKEGAVLKRGDSFEIKWKQEGLEDKRVGIYLRSYDEKKRQIWPLRDRAHNILGEFAIVENYPAEKGSYVWDIPIDLKNYFQEEPSFYKPWIVHIDYGQPMLNAWGGYIEIK